MGSRLVDADAVPDATDLQTNPPEIRRRVGVTPPEGFAQRGDLFAALEAVFPARFEPRASGSWRELDAVIALPGSVESLPDRLPTLAARTEARAESGDGAAVRISESHSLDRRLRGAVLTEATRPASEAWECGGGEEVAVWDGRPAWSLDPVGCHYEVALAPEPLQAGAPLLSLLQPGRFLSLLPLIHFLRDVAPSPWRPPPIRAAFLFDDPNLHWPTYGHIDFRLLAEQSRATGFHVAFATIPLDGWLVHPAAAQLFREHSRHLSLAFHGNDHTQAELEKIDSVAAGVRLVRRAVRRVQRLERRTGLDVARVMAPPHGRYSRAAVGALHRESFEALAASRPHPSTDPPLPVGPLEGWNPLQLAAGGFPILPRIHIDSGLETCVLRAFLDQPLVIYGHHGDLAGAPDRLIDLARAVDPLGVASWDRLDTITRSAVSTRLDAGTLRVRPFGRRVHLRVPAEAHSVRIEAPEAATGVLTRRRSRPHAGWRAGNTVSGPGLGGDLLEVVLEAPTAPDLPPAPVGGWPPIRRAMTEARDRVQGLMPERTGT